MGVFEQRLSQNISVIERKISNGTYRFTAFKERLILKGAGKAPRQISIPTVRDRLVLRALCQIIHQSVPDSTGYAPHALVDEVAEQLRAQTNERSFIRIDVKDFFPSIRHDLLAVELERHGVDELTRNLCLGAVSTPIGADESRPTLGVPQGLSISGALACTFMLRFDQRQRQRFDNYFRYVDDILIITRSDQAPETLASLRNALRRIGLKIHPINTAGKTEIRGTEEGIDYLGYHITRDLISVRASSFKRMFHNALKVITDYRYRRNTERLIFRLNLKISGCLVDGKRRGWMMFFSRTENINQLSHLDAFVRRQLRRVNFPEEEFGQIKTFVKSFHEICFNLAQTSYIPNFDDYDLAQKTEVVAVLSGRPIEEVSAFDAETIELQFSRLVGQEILDLEHDVGNPS